MKTHRFLKDAQPSAAGKTKVVVNSLTKFHRTVFVSGSFYWKEQADRAVQVAASGAEGLASSGEIFATEMQDGWSKARFEVQLLSQKPVMPADLSLTFSLTSGAKVRFGSDQLWERVKQPQSDLYERFWRTVEEGREFQKILNLGGRARSGTFQSSPLGEKQTIVFDILPDEGVDVVGDAHELSSHFPAGSLDAIYSVSVFEHLIMPWKVAVEMNHVLRLGGLVFVSTHQTIGMHDRPWDYFRFSDTSWKGIFNSATGFEVIGTCLQETCYILPQIWKEAQANAEKAMGFMQSCVLARKVGVTDLDWPVKVAAITKDNYPE